MKKLTKLDRYERCTIKVITGLIIAMILSFITTVVYTLGIAIIDKGARDLLVEGSKAVGVLLGCVILLFFLKYLYSNFRVAKNIILSILAFGGTYLVALVVMEILDCILFP